MSLNSLRAALPAYAQDIGANLDALTSETILNEQQKYGCFLACAYAIGVPIVLQAIESETATLLSSEAKTAARAAASIMAMNTIYYRAINLLQNHDYRALPTNLAMTALTNTGVDKIDFELWALAVSAISGCASCLNAHESELRKRNVGEQRIQTALRIAAVVNAASVVLRAESAAPAKAHTT